MVTLISTSSEMFPILFYNEFSVPEQREQAFWSKRWLPTLLDVLHKLVKTSSNSNLSSKSQTDRFLDLTKVVLVFMSERYVPFTGTFAFSVKKKKSKSYVASQVFRRRIVIGKHYPSTGCHIVLFWARRSRPTTPPPLLVHIARRPATVPGRNMSGP